MLSKWPFAVLAGVVSVGFFSMLPTAPARGATAADGQYDAWRDALTRIPSPGAGCFHATYPNVILDRVPCASASLGSFSAPPPRLQEASKAVGNGSDYALGVRSGADGSSQTLSAVFGSFPTVHVVGQGPSQYSLQINTNSDATTAACDGHGMCKVWQQFIYATDYPPGTQSGPALFMEYWLNTYSLLGRCPDGWEHGSNYSCFKDSPAARVPSIPATELANVQLFATAENGMDAVMLFYKHDAYVVYNDDATLDISQAWTSAEFNLVGNGFYAPVARFDAGSSLTVRLGARYPLYTSKPVTCLPNKGTTAETNNLNLGPCKAVFTTSPREYPYIQFTESN